MGTLVVTNGGRRSLGIKTKQSSIYNIGDNGDKQSGIEPSYSVLSTAQYSGTTSVDTPHYASNTISFDHDTLKILDSANGLITVLTGDTIRIRGSVSNDGVYTVGTGGVDHEIVVTEHLATEAAGAYITICKRSAPSNNAVVDNNTGLMWRRYTTVLLKKWVWHQMVNYVGMIRLNVSLFIRQQRI
jgi:hypothetical protein